MRIIATIATIAIIAITAVVAVISAAAAAQLQGGGLHEAHRIIRRPPLGVNAVYAQPLCCSAQPLCCSTSQL